MATFGVTLFALWTYLIFGQEHAIEMNSQRLLGSYRTRLQSQRPKGKDQELKVLSLGNLIYPSLPGPLDVYTFMPRDQGERWVTYTLPLSLPWSCGTRDDFKDK